MSAILSLQDVDVSFGGVHALSGVSLEALPETILGIIGPNGAGKTTLFDVICGFVPVTSGSVRIGETDVTKVAAAGRSRLGLARGFQDAGLYAALTVREVLTLVTSRESGRPSFLGSALRLPGAVHRQRHAEHLVDELVEDFGLGDYANKFIAELSTGTRRVVELASLTAQKPTVVLLDEPSSGIAQREVESLGQLIISIQARLRCAILIIEHDIPLVTAVSHELLALDQGQVVTRGAADDVLSHPHVVSAYLGVDEVTVRRSGALR